VSLRTATTSLVGSRAEPFLTCSVGNPCLCNAPALAADCRGEALLLLPLPLLLLLGMLLMDAPPHGWCPAGLVETSTNLASIKPLPAGSDGLAGFAVQCSTRSSLMPALEQVRGSFTKSLPCGAWHLPRRLQRCCMQPWLKSLVRCCIVAGSRQKHLGAAMPCYACRCGRPSPGLATCAAPRWSRWVRALP
jgi:hypothetical protein